LLDLAPHPPESDILKGGVMGPVVLAVIDVFRHRIVRPPSGAPDTGHVGPGTREQEFMHPVKNVLGTGGALLRIGEFRLEYGVDVVHRFCMSQLLGGECPERLAQFVIVRIGDTHGGSGILDRLIHAPGVPDCMDVLRPPECCPLRILAHHTDRGEQNLDGGGAVVAVRQEEVLAQHVLTLDDDLAGELGQEPSPGAVVDQARRVDARLLAGDEAFEETEGIPELHRGILGPDGPPDHVAAIGPDHGEGALHGFTVREVQLHLLGFPRELRHGGNRLNGGIRLHADAQAVPRGFPRKHHVRAVDKTVAHDCPPYGLGLAGHAPAVQSQ